MQSGPKEKQTDSCDDDAAPESQGEGSPIKPSRISASQRQRSMARADSESGNRRNGDGCAERHDEGRDDARPIETRGAGEQEDEQSSSAWPDSYGKRDRKGAPK